VYSEDEIRGCRCRCRAPVAAVYLVLKEKVISDREHLLVIEKIQQWMVVETARHGIEM
jgi:hypothetical protein